MKKYGNKATIIDLYYLEGVKITKCVIHYWNPYTNCINKVTGVTKWNEDDKCNNTLACRIAEGRAKMMMFNRLCVSVRKKSKEMILHRDISFDRMKKEKEHLAKLINNK